MAIKRAKTAFAMADGNGGMTVINAGQLVDTDKFSGYAGKESLFEDPEISVDRDESNRTFVLTGKREHNVERATAEPGEKRNVVPAPVTPPKREFKSPTRKEGE